MKIRCRCCDSKITEGPILRWDNMPKSAQFFPTEAEKEKEQGVDIQVFQCPYCGLIQLSGEPVPYFREVIRAVGVSQEMKEFRKGQYSEYIARNDLMGKKILEVGAGAGEYMEIMKEAGGNVHGLENGEESVKRGMDKGLVIHRGFPEEAETEVPDAPYDAFYIMNFLEHIPEPNVFLKAIYHNLSEGAVGLVEVPNVDMIIRKNLFSEFISDHLMYFTEKTLRRILEKNGFEVIECKTIWYDYILSAEVRKRERLDTAGFERQKEELSKSFHQFLDEKEREGKRVAAWGAGHQALANLSLAGVGRKICCIIDSAPFKQGRFTPATHIPVEAPERLRKRDIDVVVIMAAGYSEEIAGILQKQYPWIEIAVLRENGIAVG